MRIKILTLSYVAFLLFIIAVDTFAQKTIPFLVGKVQPAVVLINTYDSKSNKLGSGSGFFISKQGEIITNWHVMSGASSAVVKTSNGAMFDVKGIIAKDTKTDLALIMIKSSGIEFPFLKLQTNLPTKGEKIFVVGNPFGLEFTVSDGLISAIRELPDIGKIIQISAPISPGSSGSPIINLEGHVIGVASFQFSEGQNLNFSISSSEIAKLLKATSGEVTSLSSEDHEVPRTTDGIDKDRQEQIYVFVLDLVKSLTYIQKAHVGIMRIEKANFYFLGMDEDKLRAAIDRIQNWRNSNHADIRRVSEDLTITVQDLILMNKKVKELGSECLSSVDSDRKYTKDYCNFMYNAFFSEKKGSDLGSFYKLSNRISEISKELPLLITDQGVSKSNNNDETSLSLSSEVRFILTKKQLKEIYKYIEESQKEIFAMENASFGSIDSAFMITNLLICYDLSSKKISFPNQCNLE